jgi:TatD DNase family protein
MEQFDEDRDEVIERALEAGIQNIVSVGIDLASSNRAIELSGRYPSIIATAGIHPQEINESSEDDIKTLSRIADNARVAAIGEIGLDYHGDYQPKEQQLKIFKAQLALADELQKPVIIHCRQAEKEMQEYSRSGIQIMLPGMSSGSDSLFQRHNRNGRKIPTMGFYLSLERTSAIPRPRRCAMS